MKDFIDRIQSDILVGDGAMGTALMSLGAPEGAALERLNLTDPEKVSAVHRGYAEAGSGIVETNTFAANRYTAAKYGFEKDLEAVIAAGVKLARQAVPADVYVAGSVGPIALYDDEELSDEEKYRIFAEQAALLREAGADVIICESFSVLADAEIAVRAAVAAGLPVIGQASFDGEGRTECGASAKTVASRLRDAGAVCVGANCGHGAVSVIEAVRQMAPLGLPMSAYMNAGFPSRVANRLMYMSSPEYMGRRAVELAQSGAKIIGGCCGTNVETVRAITEALRSREGAYGRVYSVERRKTEVAAPFKAAEKTIPEDCRILTELDPPTDTDMSSFLAAADAFKEAGADCVTISDNPLASMRVDILAASAAVIKHCGMPVLPHLTARDRNKIAVRSAILGAHVLGIRNILCVTGDPVRLCGSGGTGVFNVNSIGVCEMLTAFNAAGLEDDPDFAVINPGVAFNPGAASPESAAKRLRKKKDAGAKFALTQPVYEPDKFLRAMEEVAKAGADMPIYLGIMPFASFKNADFIHNEVPGIDVPEDLRTLMASYSDRADQRKAAAEYCVKTALALADCVRGFYLIPQRNRAELITPVIKALEN
ncbi:MAG: bifunctional homocysteine S-methyltransferase/methylenetetrahydrofolate reductase [Abditibacteriota bacterium]|nr:bifunctional homocysteine S-methyltransferase/methylenetetrahydrofolate reductase [Abditibacteriota bacterium]